MIVMYHLENQSSAKSFQFTWLFKFTEKEKKKKKLFFFFFRSCKLRRIETSFAGHKPQMLVSCYSVNDTLLFKQIIK